MLGTFRRLLATETDPDERAWLAEVIAELEAEESAAQSADFARQVAEIARARGAVMERRPALHGFTEVFDPSQIRASDGQGGGSSRDPMSERLRSSLAVASQSVRPWGGWR